MRTFESILVPTDFTETSIVAAEYALAVGHRFEAEVELLHAWRLPKFLGPDLIVRSLDDETTSLDVYAAYQVSQSMQEFAQRVMPMARSHGVTLRTQIELGEPARAIVDYARSSGADLIVMGSRRQKSAFKAVLGSTTGTVLRHSHCPVLVVDPPADGEI